MDHRCLRDAVRNLRAELRRHPQWVVEKLVRNTFHAKQAKLQSAPPPTHQCLTLRKLREGPKTPAFTALKSAVIHAEITPVSAWFGGPGEGWLRCRLGTRQKG